MTNPKWKTCSCCGGPIQPPRKGETLPYDGIHQRCYERDMARQNRDDMPTMAVNGRVMRKKLEWR